ncbi:MAG: DUF6537 domain-containing protein [Candidatus Kariarchaeaceae archaeon]|jgi:Pyruvate/2-oxoacid:ferredoxin oxidoreductase gamma subunit
MSTDAELDERAVELDEIIPLDFSDEPKLFRIAVGAVGGQGGGAISEIIFHAVRFERKKNGGSKSDYSFEKRAMTPGLAQRSGSTLTSLAFLDPWLKEEGLPESYIFSEMPHRGSCDVVVSQELGELMKYIYLANPNGWVLANEMRSITPPEKSPSYIPHTTIEEQIQAAKNYMENGTYIGIDGEKIIRDNQLDPRSLNVVMMGMMSAAEVFPISKDSYLKALNMRFKGKLFDLNKVAFELGEKYYLEGRYKEREEYFSWYNLSIEEIKYRSINNAIKYRRTRAKRKLRGRVEEEISNIVEAYPEHLAKIIIEGFGQLVDFQDLKHGKWFIELVEQVYALDSSDKNRMTKEFAQNMAARIMQWNGPFRVAEHAYHDRFDKAVEEGQLFVMEKKLQPTLEEIVGMIPVPNFIYKRIPSKLYNWYHKRMEKGRSTNLKTTGLFGFSTFWFLSKMKKIRRTTVRFRREKLFIEQIMDDITQIHQLSPKAAEELCWYLGKIRGYSFVRIAHIEAYYKLTEGIKVLLAKSDESTAVNFIKNSYNMVSNAGQFVDQIDDILEDHLRGQYIIPLMLSD